MWSSSSSDYFVCPHCGAELPPDATFCRQCGASEESGWGDEFDGDVATEDEFDYDDFVAREFPDHVPHRWTPVKIVTAIVALLCILSLVLLML